MRAVPLLVPIGIPCGEVVRRMGVAGASAVIVCDGAGRIAGILTEHDITTRIAYRVEPDHPIEGVMTAPVMSIREGDPLYVAIARLRRRNLRHMPVVDNDNRPVGMLDLRDGLAVATAGLPTQVDHLTQEGGLGGLRAIALAEVALADDLLGENVPVGQIQALLTYIHTDIQRRVFDSCARSMTERGWGPMPVACTMIALGSSGRGENFLCPEQESAFILGDYPDAEHGSIDAWFVELARRVSCDFADIGFALSPSFCMPTNPMWRKTLSQWREQMRLWSVRPDPHILRPLDGFFDFACAAGPPDMAESLRRTMRRLTEGNLVFLRALLPDDNEHQQALGALNRLLVERADSQYPGQIDIKRTALQPMLTCIRVLALREGVRESSVRGRIDALLATGWLDKNEQDDLLGAFDHVTALLLRRQIADVRAGNPIGTHVHPAALTERDRDILVDSFKAIDRLRRRVSREFSSRF